MLLAVDVGSVAEFVVDLLVEFSSTVEVVMDPDLLVEFPCTVGCISWTNR